MNYIKFKKNNELVKNNPHKNLMKVKEVDAKNMVVQAEKLHTFDMIQVNDPKQYVLDVLCGLKHLERNGVISHGDIKPNNTGYCSKTNNIKLMDIDDMHLKHKLPNYLIGARTFPYVKE